MEQPQQQPSVDGTRLAPQDYLAAFDAEIEALLAAATDLGADVPGCPGWTVRDLLSHVLGVYRHKNAAFAKGAAPEGPEAGWGAIADGDDVVALLRDEAAVLRTNLDHDPAAPAWSWWPAEQTVGFWQRRMAQETAVHRWDAESATLGADDADPIADDLADDGVDELLGWLTWDWSDYPQAGADGRRVLVSTGVHSWTVTLHERAVEVGPGGEDADALLAGEPSGLLLHLWGRPGEHGIASGGDVEALRQLAERLAMATD
jgi:uncharacterized protein (TIGR03083 family)